VLHIAQEIGSGKAVKRHFRPRNEFMKGNFVILKRGTGAEKEGNGTEGKLGFARYVIGAGSRRAATCRI
jgi:hypothetical protein